MATQPAPGKVLSGRELITACAQAIARRDNRLREITDLRKNLSVAEKSRDELDADIDKMESIIKSGGEYDPAAPSKASAH